MEMINLYIKNIGMNQKIILSNDLARILPLQARRGISGEMNCQSCTLVNNRAGSSGSYASTLVPRHFAQFHAALNF